MVQITSSPIEVESLYQSVVQRNAGAVTLFLGTVREMTKDLQTLFLYYEAYEPMATQQLQVIESEILATYPDAKVTIIHRIGRLEISDIAVGIAISTPHRHDAYEANRFAIERIKQIVPIWKKEHWSDGSCWIGSQTEGGTPS